VRALPSARHVPPSGFGYPLGGLLPSTPGRAFFVPTAFLGFPPAERSPPGRWNGVSPKRRTHMPVFSATCSSATKRTGRTSQPPAPGLWPSPESRGRPLVFSLREAGCSLGVFPFQGSTAVRLAAKLSPAAPLTRFAKTARRRTGRRLRVSISGSTGPTRQPPGEPDDASQATLIGFACLFDPTGSRHKRFGLMDSPRGQPAVTDQRNPALRTYRALAGAPWEST
jgi:hypothetical protein